MNIVIAVMPNAVVEAVKVKVAKDVDLEETFKLSFIKGRNRSNVWHLLVIVKVIEGVDSIVEAVV